MGNIYVFGSLNMDLVINSPYIPASGETLKGSGFMTNPGGKGANQAVACGKLGGKIFMGGCVGGDSFGNLLLNALKDNNVNTDNINIIKNQSSGIAVIIIAGGDNRIILDSGANGKAEKKDVDKLLENAEAGDIFMTQLENPVDIVGYALKISKQKGMYCILNPAPADKSIEKYFCYTDMIVPNESELKLLSGYEDIDKGADFLLSKGIKEIVVTLGSKGYFYKNADRSFYGSCIKVKAVDTTAAGDTFCGGLATELSRGVNIEDALKFASKAASIAVTKKGAQSSIPSREYVINFKDYSL